MYSVSSMPPASLLWNSDVTRSPLRLDCDIRACGSNVSFVREPRSPYGASSETWKAGRGPRAEADAKALRLTLERVPGISEYTLRDYLRRPCRPQECGSMLDDWREHHAEGGPVPEGGQP
jgi:hypothetical protein